MTRVSASILATVALAAAFALPGCGGGADESKVIHVTRNIGGREGFRHHFEVWKGAFEKSNPGWKMELIDLGNQEGSDYYKTRIATGELPEVVMTWAMTSFLADGGHLQPLPDAYYEKHGIPLPAPYHGKRYTTQGGQQIQGIVINKKMWTDAGITQPPATWDEFIADLNTLKAKGVRPLVYGGREWSASQPLYYAIACDLYDRIPDPAKPSWTKRKDAGQVTFRADPTMKLIMQKMIELVNAFVEKGALSDGYNEEQRDFYGGKAATWMMGSWMGGDVEPNKVDFEMEYWPIPSMTGRPPIFWETSQLPNGWAISSSATGEKFNKAMAALDAFYDAEVYQALLNGESQFKVATKVAVDGPKSPWPPAQHLYDSMAQNMKKYGTTVGTHIALDDTTPPVFVSSMARVMQEVLVGTRDIDALLKILDDDWDSSRKSR